MENSLLLSMIGGMLYQVLPTIESLHKNNGPIQINWRLLILVPFYGFLGWLAGYIYFEDIKEINKVMAVHIGVSSPLLFRAMIDNIVKF